MKKINKKASIWVLVIGTVVTVVTVVTLLTVFTLVKRNQSVGDFLLKNHEEATEILGEENFEKNRFLVFFLDGNGYVSCAIIKKEWSGYQIIRTSGKLIPENPNYLCSFYKERGENRWLDWGIIVNDHINGITADGQEMNIITDIPYGFRICWITGTGEEPQIHTEGSASAVALPSVCI